MPTGYTAKIHEGEDQSFTDFAISCSRAFGAHALVRTEPQMPLPTEYEIDFEQYNRIIQSDMHKIEKFWKMSDKEIQSIMTDERQERIENLENQIQENKIAQTRFQAMLEKAESWTPPTDEHTNFKEFMINQLKDGIKETSGNYAKEQLTRLHEKEETVDDYRSQRIRELLENIRHIQDRLSYEIKVTAERNQWIKALHQSLEE